jgi:hypothetical protein
VRLCIRKAVLGQTFRCEHRHLLFKPSCEHDLIDQRAHIGASGRKRDDRRFLRTQQISAVQLPGQNRLLCRFLSGIPDKPIVLVLHEAGCNPFCPFPFRHQADLQTHPAGIWQSRGQHR